MKPRRMLIGLVVGATAGLLAHALGGDAAWVGFVADNLAAPAGTIFLRLLFMLVVPLVFSALVVGIAGIDGRQLGRLGVKTLVYALVLSFVAAVIGLVLVNLVRPGAGEAQALRALARAAAAPAAVLPAARTTAADLIVALVPDNPVKAAASGDLIGVIVFALVFGVAARLTRTEAAARLRETLQGIYDVTMTCIDGVLRLAPIGVGALVFVMTLRMGTGLLRPLAAYLAVVTGGLAFHMVVVYSVMLRVLGKTSPWRFFRDARVAIVTAFSTSSSSATLPTALRVAEEELRLPRTVSRFVLTVGATANQNGTALYEGVTILFLAQLAGVPLSFVQQLAVMVIAVVAGVGSAGVPGGSLPVMAMILGLFRIPPEGLGLILGVDRLLDMARTTLNVVGDLVVATCIAGGEREADVVPLPLAHPPAG
jgi:DAACS family dicarboxylate/amino acid:cation (Na+ or H+) symporter